MEVMKPDKQMGYGVAPERAIMCDAPTMTVLEEAYGKNAAAVWLVEQLTDLALYAGVKDKMDTRQYEQLATIIVNEFGYLKATELMLFFYRYKSGNYGKFYGSVDPITIMTALRDQFIVERNKVIEDAEKAAERVWRDSLYDDPNRGARKDTDYDND